MYKQAANGSDRNTFLNLDYLYIHPVNFKRLSTSPSLFSCWFLGTLRRQIHDSVTLRKMCFERKIHLTKIRGIPWWSSS